MSQPLGPIELPSMQKKKKKIQSIRANAIEADTKMTKMLKLAIKDF